MLLTIAPIVFVVMVVFKKVLTETSDPKNPAQKTVVPTQEPSESILIL